MSIKTHFLMSSGNLKSITANIKKITQSTTKLINKKVKKIGEIDIVFYDNPEATIKEIGIGGYTPKANVVFISLDCKNPSFKRSLEKELSYTITHEINHAIRFRTPIPKDTLFEAMISEGLADHFAMEILGAEKPKWSDALTEKEVAFYLNKASKEWHDEHYNHNAWFYGSKEKNIPRWTGYTLGFKLVEKYLKNNPKISASELISSDANIFLN